MASTQNQSERRGFPLPCPYCGCVPGDTHITVDLLDIDGDEALQCSDCERAFSLVEVKDIIGAWQKAIAWLESAPTYKPAE